MPLKTLTHEEFKRELQRIKSIGFVNTARGHDTGVGKTLEDLLGIEENNIQGPDLSDTELKADRKNTQSMISLFTKAPISQRSKRAMPMLYEKYKYDDKDGKGKVLHCTITGNGFNNLNGMPFFKADVTQLNGERIVGLVHYKDGLQAFWTDRMLKEAFLTKYPKGQLYFVVAENSGKGSSEKFWYNEAYFLKGFSYEKFIELLKNGYIKIDFRIGVYPNGKPHDRGTGFRVLPTHLDKLFDYRERLI